MVVLKDTSCYTDTAAIYIKKNTLLCCLHFLPLLQQTQITFKVRILIACVETQKYYQSVNQKTGDN